MLRERIEGKWIDLFAEVFAKCGVVAGDSVAILSETQSRRSTSSWPSWRCSGSAPAVPPGRAEPAPVGAGAGPLDRREHALQDLAPVVNALASSVFVVDCTVEGLMHAAELPQILEGGARVLYDLQRAPRSARAPAARRRAGAAGEGGHAHAARGARRCGHLARRHRTRHPLEGARVGGVWGYTEKPGTLSHWPGGLCLAFPEAGSVNGTLVLAPGDVNLTFKRYMRDAGRA